MQERLTLSSLLALLAALAFTPALRGEWIEALWAEFPDGIDASAADDQGLLASGQWRDLRVTLFDPTLDPGELCGSGEARGVALDRVDVPNLRIGQTCIAQSEDVIAMALNSPDGARLGVLVCASKAGASTLIAQARSLLNACEFVAAKEGTRGVMIPGSRVAFALPASYVRVAPKRWQQIERAPDGSVNISVASLLHTSGVNWRELGGFRERVESHMQARGFNPDAGQGVTLFDAEVARLRTYKRDADESASKLQAMTVCMSARGRFAALLVQSTNDEVQAELSTALAYSGRLIPASRSRVEGARIGRTGDAMSVVAIAQSNGRVHLLLVDEGGSSLIWRDERIELRFRREDAALDEEPTLVHSSLPIGLAGAGLAPPPGADQVVLTLRDGRALIAKIQRIE